MRRSLISVSKTDYCDYDSVSVESTNFDKVQKFENQCGMGPTFHAKIAEIICSNFASQISQNIFTP